jgi:hypothetical protein
MLRRSFRQQITNVLILDTVDTSETSANFYQTSGRDISEDSQLLE